MNWFDVGLNRPANFKYVILIITISIIVLIPFSYLLRNIITSIINQGPNLEAFAKVKNNPAAFLIGLIVVWIFGAFCEEMFFRGFLMNAFFKLIPGSNNKVRWGISLLITSFLVGIGHTYQGITGMIITGVIGFCFGLIYLKSKNNLWPGILTHGLYDTIAFIIVYIGFNLDKTL